jgi:DeoR family transcriptional regulator of aga operon
LRAARAVSQRTVALIDSTKFGRDSLLRIFTAQEPEEIITDDGVTADVIAEYKGAGVNVVVAQPIPVPVR